MKPTARNDTSTAPPTVIVHVCAPLRRYCGDASELTLEAATVAGVLAVIERQYPDLYRGVCDDAGAVRRHVNLFVNTQHMRDFQGLETPLKSGDTVTILPAVSGG